MRFKQSLVLCLLAISLFAQEQAGLRTSNWAGVTSLYYNPSAFSASHLSWDLQVVAGGVFVENDYAYLQNTTVLELITQQPDLVDATFIDGVQAGQNEVLYAYYDAIKPMNNAVHAFLALPALAVRINKKWTIGFLTKSRVAFNANRLHETWSYPSLNNWRIGQTKTTTPIWTTGMMWSEGILNAAYSFKREALTFHVGANAKLLLGHHGITAFVPNSTDITLYQNYYHVDAEEARYSFTDLNNGFATLNNGFGFGVDLGFSIVKKNELGVIVWTAQASLLDIGQVTFTNNSSQHHVSTNSTSFINRASLLGVQSLEEFAEVISTDVYGDPNASLVSNEFRIITPTALTLAADFALPRELWLNFSMARSIIVSPHQLERDNHFTTSIRYETKWFEIGVPFVLYRDIYARAGAWIRFGPLTIGSDHITTWFIPQKQLTGTDVYFALRLNNLLNPNKKPKSPDECYW